MKLSTINPFLSKIVQFRDFTMDRKNNIYLFSLASLAVYVAYVFFNIYIHEYHAAYINGFCAALNIFSFLFYVIKWERFIVGYFIIVNSLCGFFFESYSGPETGVILFTFPLMLASASFYRLDVRFERNILIAIIFWLAFLASINFITDYEIFYYNYLSENERVIVFQFNLVSSLLLMGIFILKLIKSNLLREKLMENLIARETKFRLAQQEKHEEKQLLLVELQYGIKTNLSLINNLIKQKIEQATINSIPFFINESIHSVHTISHAFQSQNFEHSVMSVNSRRYFNELINYWIQLQKEKEFRWLIDIKTDDFNVPVKQIIPAGLIIHELLCLYSFECKKNQSFSEKIDFKLSSQKEHLTMDIVCSIENLLDLNRQKWLSIATIIESLNADFIKVSKNYIQISIPFSNENFRDSFLIKSTF
jgi:hypothetical protein